MSVSRIFLMLLLLGAISACTTSSPVAPPAGEASHPRRSRLHRPRHRPRNRPQAALRRRPKFALRPSRAPGILATRTISGVRSLLCWPRCSRSTAAPVALIVPHAGYTYSGQVAAVGIKQLAQETYDVAVIIGADHAEPISDPIAVYPDGGFETPLGVVRGGHRPGAGAHRRRFAHQG